MRPPGILPVGAPNILVFCPLIGNPHGATDDACYLKYMANSQTMYLYTNGSFSSGGQIDSSNTLSNSICSVNLASTTAPPSCTTLAVSPGITSTGAFPGSRSILLEVADRADKSSGFIRLVTWTIP